MSGRESLFPSLRPFVHDPDFVLYVGDVRDTLAQLPEASIDCCVTSPPYWGLRDYGTASWEGGDPDCEHRVGGQVQDTKAPGAISAGVRPGVDASRCLDCGAARIDSQIGLERTPGEYVDAMVAVFADVRRVLKPAGTLWLNLGDSYNAYNAYNGNRGTDSTYAGDREAREPEFPSGHGLAPGLKPKDLVGIPWRVALALQADGWTLRSDIVWHKPNPMPESVTDRPTKSHEYLFLLTKGPRYFYDADAIAEPATWYGPNGQPKEGPHSGQMKARAGAKRPQQRRAAELAEQHGLTEAHFEAIRSVGITDTGKAQVTRNARSVWSIQTMQYADAHFATFPEELPRRCILAGCPEGGTVLDPFMGSGTTAKVARDLGRQSVGVELNTEYAGLCARRLQQQSLLAVSR